MNMTHRVGPESGFLIVLIIVATAVASPRTVKTNDDTRLEYDIRISGNSAVVLGTSFSCDGDCETLHVEECIKHCEDCPNSCEAMVFCKNDEEKDCFELLEGDREEWEEEEDSRPQCDDLNKLEKILEKSFEIEFERKHKERIWEECEKSCKYSSAPGKSCQAHCRTRLRKEAQRKYVDGQKDRFSERCDNERVRYRKKKADERLRYDLSLREGGAALIVNSDYDIEGKFKFSVVIDRIVEYIPDEVGGFQLHGNDTVVNIYGSGLAELSAEASIALEDWKFGDLEALEAAANDTEKRIIKATTNDGIFTILFYINPTPQMLDDGLGIDLNDLKFDFVFDVHKMRERGWFATNDTEMAIIASIESEMEHRICQNTPSAGAVCLEREEEASGELALGGRLGWVNQITCDNGPSADLAIGWATLENDIFDCGDDKCEHDRPRVSAVAWSLNVSQADGLCLWDPVVKGRSFGASSGVSSTVLSLTALFTSALLHFILYGAL